MQKEDLPQTGKNIWILQWPESQKQSGVRLGGGWHLHTSGKKKQRRKKKKKTKKILNFSSCCDSTWGSLPGRFSTRGKRKCVNTICTIQWIKLALEFTFPVPKLPLPRASETEVMSSNFPWLPVMPETDTLTPREDDGEIAGPSHFHKNSRELLPYLVQN